MTVRTIVKVRGEHARLALTDCLSNWTSRAIGGGWHRITLEHHSAEDVRELAGWLGLNVSVRTIGSAP